MANLNMFPIDDVTQMAEAAGFTISELQAPSFTNENLSGLMQSFYAGTLGAVVNPGQGIRSQVETIEAVLAEQRSFFAGESDIGQFLRSAGKTILDKTGDILKPFGIVLATLPFVLLGGITLGILLLARKAK